DFQRLGHLRYFPLPGGDAASVETARPALALLVEAFGAEAADLPITRRIVPDEDRRLHLLGQINAHLNCPVASSLGRMFDAVAALAGVAEANRYEGQAPMMLESIVADGVDDTYPVVLTDADPFTIDHRPITAAIVADVDAGHEPGTIAARFHNTVASFCLRAAEKARWRTGLNLVTLSGGCFANRYLSARLAEMLRGAKFEVLTHRSIPCNDGCVALGQAVTAAKRLAGGGRPVARKDAGETRY
ncbi:MAG: Kae1-like domain-containing protein, partial [Planctomycetota bacterium]